MARRIFRPSGRFFLFILSVTGIACFGTPAFAASSTNIAAGCNAQVWSALTAKAAAQVAYDTAITREMINKPYSVLTLTCFDQAAGVSAAMGGAIFSGDFSAQLGTIMPVTAPPYNCTGPNTIGALWNTIATSGIDNGAPYATFNDLMSATQPPAGGGQEFNAGWSAANTPSANTQAVLGANSALATAVAALPGPPNTPLDFSNAKSSCDVLKQAGIFQGTCPQAGSFAAGP